MGLRQREWAARAQAKLIKDLGGKCVDCGATQNLELDHIEPMDWPKPHHSYEWSWRISRYRKEAKEGKLTVRCGVCNASKNNGPASQPRMQPITNGALQRERVALTNCNKLADNNPF